MTTLVNTQLSITSTDSATVPALVPISETMFRNHGEFWRVVYQGKSLTIGTTKGLVYIGYLLHHPDERIHCYDLSRLTESVTASANLDNGFDDRDPAMERVRKAVTNRIRDTIARMAKQHPALGRHLANAVQTGLQCWYRPERTIYWAA